MASDNFMINPQSGQIAIKQDDGSYKTFERNQLMYQKQTGMLAVQRDEGDYMTYELDAGQRNAIENFKGGPDSSIQTQDGNYIDSVARTPAAPQESIVDKFAKENPRTAFYADRIATGISGIAGLPGDVQQLGDFLSDKAMRGIDRLQGFDEAERDQREEQRHAKRENIASNRIVPNLPSTQDIRSVLPLPRVEAPTKTDKIIGSAAEIAAQLLGTKGIGAITGSAKRPFTREIVPAAIEGGGAGAGAQFIGDEFGDLTRGTPYEQAARFIGNLTGGLAGGLAPGGIATGLRKAFGRDGLNTVGEGLGDIPLNAYDKAQKLIDDSRALGIPITGAEALSKVLEGGNLPILNVQRFAENSIGGGPKLAQFYAQRPQANQQALGNVLNQFGPRAEQPLALGGQVQDAAEKAFRQEPQYRDFQGADAVLARGLTPEQAGPTIRGPLQERYSEVLERRRNIADDLYLKADRSGVGISTQPTIELLNRLAQTEKGDLQRTALSARALFNQAKNPSRIDTSAAGLRRTLKTLNNEITAATRAGRNEEARLLFQIKNSLENDLNVAPALKEANSEYAHQSQNVVRPYERPGVGNILEKDQFNQYYNVPDEKVGSAILNSGTSGVENFNRIAPAKSIYGFEDYLVTDARNNFTRNGQIDTQALLDYVKQRDAVLSEFPLTKNRLNALGEAKQGVDKLQRESLLGQFTQTSNPAAQSDLLLSKNPRFTNEEEIRSTVAKIAKENPNAVQGLVRQALEDVYNKAGAALEGGANQRGAARFARDISGNEQARRNLKATVEALPDGKTKFAALERLFDVYEAQGTRLTPNSATDINKRLGDNLSGTALGALSKPFSAIREGFQNIALGSNTRKISEILTDPRSAELLKKLALSQRGSLAARQLALQIITLQQSQAERSPLFLPPPETRGLIDFRPSPNNGGLFDVE